MAVATCIETPTRFARRTVADGTGIPIGTLLKLTDSNTAIATSADNDPFAGIAWEEKTASDGIVEITCAMNGRWSMTTTAAAITAGAIVSIGGANAVLTAAAADLLPGSVVGKALNTVGGGGGTVIVEVGVVV